MMRVYTCMNYLSETKDQQYSDKSTNDDETWPTSDTEVCDHFRDLLIIHVSGSFINTNEVQN